MAILKNNQLIRALLRQPTDYTPVWLMRQAGRYLPEYCQIRQQAGDFLTLCKTPDLACEVTMQPLDRFNLDAAILFSDILTIPDAMGLGLYFSEGEGPKFQYPLREEHQIRQLPILDPEIDLAYVMSAIQKIKRSLNNRMPLIGFAGSPWTLACYMVEGGGSKDFRTIKTMLFKRPDLIEHILQVLAQNLVLYLNAQIAAGAQVIMLFDTWGGILSHLDYQKYSLRYLEEVLKHITRHSDGQIVPTIIFTKGGGLWLEQMVATGCDAIGLDWTIDIAQAKRTVNNRVALQGNLDPMVLLGDEKGIIRETQRILERFGGDNGHVFNLGHGISQYTEPEKVNVLIETVHQYSLAKF